MSDEKALLAAIFEHPEEDTPRLMYADWLDEQGGTSNAARAEYIRLEIEHSRNFPETRWSKEKQDSRKRAHQLFAKHYRDWFPDLYGPKNILRGSRGSPDMGRGFPYRLLCDSAKLLQVGERLMQLAPITEVEFRNFADGDLRKLVQAPWVRGFRDLNLSGYSNAPDWTPLAECPYFPELLELVPYGGYLGPEGAARIAAANNLPKLQRFVLAMNIGDEALAALFGGVTFTGLRTLSLSSPGGGSKPYGITGVRAVCESQALASLKSLDLRCYPMDGMVAALTKATFWSGLERVDLLRNNLGDEDLAEMLRGPTSLRELALADNKITAKGAKMLAEHPAFANFTKLDLAESPLRDTGICALVNSPRAANLQILRVPKCGFGLKGVEAIANSPYLANLRELTMYSNECGLKGARMLAASPYLGKLTYLWPGDGITATAKKELKARFGSAVR